AISVPLAKQTAAPSLAHKGIGYGIASQQVDGNDAAAVYAAVRAAVDAAASGAGPALLEALTYRVEAHTNADDATRYRTGDEVQEWLARAPLLRLGRYLRGSGSLTHAAGAGGGAARPPAARGTGRGGGRAPARAAVSRHVTPRPPAPGPRQQRALAAELDADR